ncbi:hypothetical protein F4780DRAFT_555376 [Xylariomycetidae sp. FL0641]|nr:hypothetical protein F4780DRAFT_555376 [Xylariomycetidae sp. FL0641]
MATSAFSRGRLRALRLFEVTRARCLLTAVATFPTFKQVGRVNSNRTCRTFEDCTLSRHHNTVTGSIPMLHLEQLTPYKTRR